MTIAPKDRIYVALDTPDVGTAISMAQQLAGYVGGVKLGKEFFVANGPDAVRAVGGLGMPVFLDLKFHDIPNTVAGAVRSALPSSPAILNVHAMGGSAMMRAAKEALYAGDGPAPMLIAVTVLTSLGDDDLAELGISVNAEEQVVRLAKLTQSCGLDGVVCSPREIAQSERPVAMTLNWLCRDSSNLVRSRGSKADHHAIRCAGGWCGLSGDWSAYYLGR